MKKGINYGLFMVITMGFIYTYRDMFVILSYGIGLVWSIYMLWSHLLFAKKWDWFFSSTLTWQLVGIHYLTTTQQPTEIIPYTGILLSFAFAINAIFSLISPMPFTTLFDKNKLASNDKKYLTIHIKGTLIWTFVIIINILFNLSLKSLAFDHLAGLTMVNVFLGILIIKKYLRFQFNIWFPQDFS